MPTAAAIREHYDCFALIYRAFWGDHIHHGLFVDGNGTPEAAQVRMLDYCISLLDLRGGEDVLDVGCGHGGTLVHLARALACRGTGLTISPRQARLGQHNAGAAGVGNLVNFVVGDADRFEFHASAFDLVWTMESSEHFADKRRYFANVAHTLRPGGQLLLAAWIGAMKSSRSRDVARAFLCPELWTVDQYRSAIESAGMQTTAGADLSAQVVRTWEICQKRVAASGPVVRLLPRAAREFVEGISIILDAYRSGELGYTVLVARKMLRKRPV